ncbi:hypothetical protein [Salinicoccus roseus]|uniref:hypothetical protein n=1 Tax=Salinicoccus roseus TaxID=45670 RepID=UPI002300FAD7|nr:hypothetical protein [Salinicoccus roseus]
MARQPSIFAYYKNGMKLKQGTIPDIAKYLGRSISATYNLAKTDHLKKCSKHYLICVAEQVNIYEYKRDGHVIATGTMQEIAEQTGISKKTIRWYNSASSVKRNMNYLKLIRTEERYYDSENTVQNMSV